MRCRGTRLLVLVAALATAVTAAAVTGPAPAFAAAAPSKCRVADALRGAGEQKLAERAYVAIVRATPTERCAIDGLKSITAAKPAASCRAANDLLADGKLNEAFAAYDKVGNTSCATAGKNNVRDVRRLCAAGDADQAAHRNSDALTAYKAALTKAPKAACATDGLADLAPSSVTRWVDWLVGALPVAAAVLAIVFVAGLVWLLLGYAPWLYPIVVKTRLIGTLVAPRLTLQAFADDATGFKVGGSITARIKETLQRFRDEALSEDPPDYELDFGASDEEFVDIVSGNGNLQKAIDKALDASSRTKVIEVVADFLLAILPTPHLGVAGVCEPPAGEAVATVTLERNSRLEAAAVIRSPAASGPASAVDYLALAEPSAVWVQYVLAQVYRRRRPRPDEAKSYALLRQGLVHQRAGALPAAQQAYEQAIALNSGNWAARANLAVTIARLGGDYATATAIVAESLEEMTGTPW